MADFKKILGRVLVDVDSLLLDLYELADKRSDPKEAEVLKDFARGLGIAKRNASRRM